MKRLIAAVMAAPLCAAMAHAQTPPPGEGGDVLTLAEALIEANSRAPTPMAAAAGIRAAEAGRAIAGLRPNPSIAIDTENALGTGPYRGLDESDTTVVFAMPVELGGKRSARVAVADARIRRAEVESAAAMADLRLNVTLAYTALIAAERRAAVADAQLAVTGENLRIARDRVMVGANSPIDEQRAVLEDVKARAEADAERRTLAAARTALRQYAGDAALGALDAAWFDRAAPAVYGPAQPNRAEGTLALVAAARETEVAELGVRLARSQRAPDLTVTAGTRRLEASNDQAMVFGISIPLPVFNNGKAVVIQASRDRDQAEARQRVALFEAEQAIAAAEAERDRAATAVRTSGPALAAAGEAARIARIGYAEGKFDQIVLLDAERTLLDTRRAAIDARADYHNAIARLERLTTRLVGAGRIQ